MFDRDYIGSWDLNGREATVRIRSVEAGVLTSQGNRKTKKPIIHFEGKDKGLALNKTNAKAIAAMYGNDTTKWIGKAITIYPTTTTFGSETVDCIRVKQGIPQQSSRGNGRAQAPVQPSVDWREALGLHGDNVTAQDAEEAHAHLSADPSLSEASRAQLTHALGYALKELGDG
jgi:hypothetical protein